MPPIINSHTHIFTFDHVPVGFLPLNLVKLLSRNQNYLKIVHLLNRIVPFTDKDVLERFATFVEQGYEKKQAEILQSLMRFYPEDTRFVVLPMDMKYMGAGDPKVDYLIQMKGLLELKEDPKYKDNLLPFVFAHPERPGVTEHVKEYILDHKFSGIKIYPPLGYYPFDPRLDGVYAFAEANQVPVMTHCSHPVVFYKGKITKEMLVNPLTGEKLEKRSNKKFADYWTHPDNYLEVFRKFPDLKLCFGHFGGSSEWLAYYNHTSEKEYRESWFYKVKGMIKTFKNAYADVSYALATEELYPMLNLILQDNSVNEKVLFGSDFYMAKIEGKEFKFSAQLRSAVGEENFWKIASQNPMRYLKTNLP